MRSPLLDARRPTAFFLNGIGDHFLSLPAVRALASMFDGRLSLLVSESLAGLLYRDLPLREVVLVRDWTYSPAGYEFDAARAAASLRGCDLFLALNPWHTASVDELLARLGAPESIGFFPCFSRPLERDYDRHSVDLAFDVVRAAAPQLNPEDFAQPPELTPDDRRVADALRGACGTARILVVHTESRAGKCVPPSTWAAALDEFLEQRPDHLVLALGTNDGGLENGPRREWVVPCHGLRLGTSIALVGHADLFAGVDSCMLHAADLYGVPSVGLFVSTAPHEFGLRFTRHRHVTAGGGEVATAARLAEALLQLAR